MISGFLFKLFHSIEPIDRLGNLVVIGDELVKRSLEALRAEKHWIQFQKEGECMNKPWFMYPFTIHFGDTSSNVQLGGAHDLDIGAPANYPVTALLPGTIVDIWSPIWGRQVGVQLDSPYKGIPYMGFLHLSAVNPTLREGHHVSKGDLIGWVGGATNEAQYAGTSNPTGQNFLNDPSQSSQIQVGVALMRGPKYGEGLGWVDFIAHGVDWSLNPTQIILDAQHGIERGDGMLQITDPFAAAHFKQVAEDRWHCNPTNIDVIGGILSFYRRIGGAPRLPLTGEQHDLPEVVYQMFEAGVIVFDPGHKLDHPTGFEPSYLLKLDSELAKKLLQ